MKKSTSKKKTQKKRKVTRRSKSQYPGLDKKVNLRIRQELLDQDYIHKLSDEEKQWLSNFNEEYISASFSHPGKKLHRTKKARQDCYNRNNARNRDSFAITKSLNILKGDNKLYPAMEKNRSTNYNETEDVLIVQLDDVNEKKE